MKCKLRSLLRVSRTASEDVHVLTVPTVDTPGLIAVVRTVVNLVALFGAVDAGSVTALELIGSTCQQSWGTPGRRRTLGARFREQLVRFE